MSLKAQLYKSIKSLPEGIAGGYIDLAGDKLIAMMSTEPHPEGVLERMVGISKDLFRGPNVMLIEEIFSKSRGIPAGEHHYFQEFLITNETLAHVFIRVPNQKDHVVTFVCRNQGNQLFSLVKARAETLKLSASYRAEYC